MKKLNFSKINTDKNKSLQKHIHYIQKNIDKVKLFKLDNNVSEFRHFTKLQPELIATNYSSLTDSKKLIENLKKVKIYFK